MFSNIPKSFDNKFEQGSNKYYGVYEGIIKDNADFQRMGRLAIWVPELGTRENDSSGWVMASYCSPFGGATDPSSLSAEQTKTYEGTQRSYGFWAVPPDKNNRVIVMFLNGEVSRPIWIGCMFQQYANNMVPNIPAQTNYQYDEPVPVAEYNKKSGIPYSDDATKPYHKKHYEALRNQGLSNDPVRGYSQNGATSDPTPKVYGMLTPKGHYWSLEDTDGDEKIRLRSGNGAQLLLDDTRSIVYIVNQQGNGWVEIDSDGKVMVYSEGGIGIRSNKDISLSADRDIIMEAGRNIVTKAGDNIFIETDNMIEKITDIHSVEISGKRQEKIAEEQKYVEGNLIFKIDGSYTAGALNINLNADEYNNFTSKRDTNINAGEDMQIGSAGVLNVATKSTMNLIARGNIVQSGKKFIQNTGGSGVSPAPASGADVQFSKVPVRPTFTRKDVYQPTTDEGALYREVQSVASVYPTHEPSAQHGVSTFDRDESSNSEALNQTAEEKQESVLNNSILITKEGFMESLLDDLRRHEGVIYQVYSDPLLGDAAPTAGVGHLLSSDERAVYNIGDTIPPYQVEKWFIADVQEAITGCENIYGQYWNDIPDVVKSILANMCFNLGEGGLRNFSNMNNAVINSDWETAADEMKDSLWYTQTGRRAKELEERMRSLTTV